MPGADGPAGINTIKSLRMSKFSGKIVASDPSPISAGFFMADASEIIPEADNTLFKDHLFKIVSKHKINVLMPSSGYDIFPYSDCKDELLELGALAVVSDKKSLEICRDKFMTHKALYTKFDLPFTTIDEKKIQEKHEEILRKALFYDSPRFVAKVSQKARELLKG